MSLNLDQKKQVVEDVSAVVSNAKTAIVAEYRGLTVEQMKTLRREAHENNVYVRVVKIHCYAVLLKILTFHAWMSI